MMVEEGCDETVNTGPLSGSGTEDRSAEAAGAACAANRGVGGATAVACER